MRSVRGRITVAAMVVVGVALAAAAFVLVVTLRSNLTGDVESTALLGAQAMAAEIAAGGGPDQLELSGDDEFVQVIDASGSVVWMTGEAEGMEVIADMAPGASRIVTFPPEEERFAVAAVSSGDLVVVAGRSLEHVDESSRALIALLFFGVPVLTLVLGVITWFVVGRALRPVDEIRSEVESISAADLSQRVPVPNSRDEVADLAETMNRMLQRLEAAQKAQRRFVADASHELRSPLASIRQHAEVAIAHPDPAEEEQLADSVLAEAIRMQQLVDDLLLLARADEITLATRVAAVDLDDLVLEEARRLLDSTPFEIDTTGVEAARTRGNSGALRRLVRNLGENAARHAATRIALATRENGDAVELSVDDDGPGIPEEQQAAVFERFVRLDEARTRDDGGSGLGLAIVAEVASSHGGSSRATDSALGGARIEVRLPSAPD